MLMFGDNYDILYSDKYGNMVKAKKGCIVDLAKIKIRGNSNIITLEEGVDIQAFSFNVNGNNNITQIGEGTRLAGKISMKGFDQSFIVGKQTSFQSVSVYIGEGQSVKVGDDCMFSARIEIRTTDSHSIYEEATGKRLNKPQPVVIGNHVWLGKEVIVSKGVTLKNNLIVGAKSFVNKSFNDENVILAGAPAKVVRTGVNWTRELLPYDDE